jgi:hypothetical protein
MTHSLTPSFPSLSSVAHTPSSSGSNLNPLFDVLDARSELALHEFLQFFAIQFNRRPPKTLELFGR